MFTTRKTVILLLAVVSFATSCSKKDDIHPLTTREMLLSGRWSYTKSIFDINDSHLPDLHDAVDSFTNCYLTFRADSTYLSTNTSDTFIGGWKLKDSGRTLVFTSSQSNSVSSENTIVKLTSDKIILYNSTSGAGHDFWFYYEK